jgi:hypothetical protein
MATHDYIISNASGAAVRADLNNALAAIATNNSSATAPTTTYAYQWWADTGSSPTVMKLRNAANSAWITLFQLDGEWTNIAFENGTAAAPSIYFKDSGTDTGIYSPGTDQVAITTGGTGRLFVDASGNVGVKGSTVITTSAVSAPTFQIGDGAGSPALVMYSSTTGASQISFADATTGAASYDGYVLYNQNSQYLAIGTASTERLRLDSSGRVGIGTTGPTQLFHLAANNCNLYLQPVSNAEARIQAEGGTGGVGTAITFHNYNGAANGERARIDSSGRLLVGTSTAFSQYSAGFQLVNNSGSGIDCGRFDNSASSSDVILTKGRGGSVGTRGIVSNNDQLGQIGFKGDDGSTLNSYAAAITAFVDGTPGTNDMPGRLVFSTTADGAGSPTERMRIDNLGRIFTYNANTGNNSLTVGNAAGAGTAVANFIGAYSATAVNTGTTSFIVWTNGNVQNTNNSYTAISDAKLKENIVDASSQWADIKALQVRNYNLKEGQTHRQIGLVAQEVEPISPGLVYETPDRDEDGNETGEVTKSVNYSVLYMKAVKALQEAMERIETLEAKVAALEGA